MPRWFCLIFNIPFDHKMPSVHFIFINYSVWVIEQIWNVAVNSDVWNQVSLLVNTCSQLMFPHHQSDFIYFFFQHMYEPFKKWGILNSGERKNVKKKKHKRRGSLSHSWSLCICDTLQILSMFVLKGFSSVFSCSSRTSIPRSHTW